MINTLPQSLIDTVTNVISNQTHIMVDGKQKHRYNSKGDAIHSTDDGITKFHKWFGDSKAVDAQGRPLVVYHGTDTKFEKFDNKYLGAKGAGPSKLGHWFADDPEYAKIHGDHIIKAYLKTDSPHVTETQDKLQSLQQVPEGKDGVIRPAKIESLGRQQVRTPGIYSVKDATQIKTLEELK